MAEPGDRRRRHFILEGFTEAHAYTPRQRGPGSETVPSRDREQHAAALRQQLAPLHEDAAMARQAQEAAGLREDHGLTIEFESFPEIELAFESLADERGRVHTELLNVRREGDKTFATVFVPDGKLERFERYVEDYLIERRNKAGGKLDHQPLIDTIQRIRRATLDALWTDDRELLPRDEAETVWWEVWLPVRRDRDAVVGWFRERAADLGIEVATGDLEFRRGPWFSPRPRATSSSAR
jgi:hypothetical protein